MKNGFKKATILIMISLAITVSLLIYCKLEWDQQQATVEKQLASFQIIKGAKVDSPSVVISVSALNDFLSKIRELDANTVYTDNGDVYFVFNEPMTIAYYYDAFPFLRATVLSLTIIVVLLVVMLLCVGVVFEK